jgi:hypothetical protein
VATSRPFAFNTGSTISGTEQLGDLAIGVDNIDYDGGVGGVTWWNGPDEDLGYIICRPNFNGTQPNPVGIPAYVRFLRSKLKTEESFVNLVNTVYGQSFTTGDECKTYLNNNGFWTSWISLIPSATPTPTPTVTPTNTTTVTPTPTNTPTPTVSPIPVTGYAFNLVALPYNFPSSGNTIMNNEPSITSGSTNPNVLATGSRGLYWNSIDMDGVDRTNYFSGFTGQSITITMSQTGSTAVYSGDTNSLKQWIQSGPGTGFVFGSNLGVPPSNTPSGSAVLIQSATTQWTIGLPVYISVVVNPGVTPTPTPTNTITPTPTPTNTVTPTVTPTNTPTPTNTVTPTNTPTPTSSPVPTIQSFTTIGTTSWTAPAGVTSVEYLVVGGGGGGGNAYDNSAGGGGGAGMVLSGTTSVTPGQSYTVTVGAGGLGGAGTYPGSYDGASGGTSVFSTITAIGGGQGWGTRKNQAIIGAAQVGDTTAPTGGGGGGGGTGGKGGGGATGNGTINSGITGGSGGAGLTSSISGFARIYGVGGASANSGSANGSANGTTNRGNGGQAAGAPSGSGRNGGTGGSGIVILKYIIP